MLFWHALNIFQTGTTSIRAVTVRQIINAYQSHSESEILVDGAEVGHVSRKSWWESRNPFSDMIYMQVTFVGIIRNLARNATNISYNIEDGTGMIDVRTWADNSSTSLMSEDEYQWVQIALWAFLLLHTFWFRKNKIARTDQYVRIIGLIKTFQNRRTVNAGHIRAITDYNEIFYHRLDAIYTHLQVTRPAGVSGCLLFFKSNPIF